MSRPIKSSKWKSLWADRVRAERRAMTGVLVAGLLLTSLAVLVSMRLPASQVSTFVVCTRSTPGVNPLLYPPDTRLVEVSPRRARLFSEFELTSRPQLSYRADRLLFSARRAGDEYAQIWTMDTDGSAPRRVVTLDADCVTPAFLPDGRIVFSRVDRSAGCARPAGSLVVRGDDATLTRISFGADLDIVERILGDGRILIRRISESNRAGEQLVLRPDGTELEEYVGETSAISVEARAVGGDSIQPHAADGAGSGASSVTLPDGYRILDSIRVVPRPRPPVATSIVQPGRGYGWLLCLDARLTDLRVDLEAARRVRVVDARSGEVLGIAPFSSDNSFYLKVPADRLLRLELLDETGGVLVRQSQGIWVRPNEHRGCLGCHEPRYLSPANRSPLALEGEAIAIAGEGETQPVKARGRP